MIVLAYCTDTPYAPTLSTVILYMVPAAALIGGLHCILNARLLNFISAMNRASSGNVEAEHFLKDVDSPWIVVIVGVVCILSAIFLLSCLVLNFPYSL